MTELRFTQRMVGWLAPETRKSLAAHMWPRPIKGMTFETVVSRVPSTERADVRRGVMEVIQAQRAWNVARLTAAVRQFGIDLEPKEQAFFLDVHEAVGMQEPARTQELLYQAAIAKNLFQSDLNWHVEEGELVAVIDVPEFGKVTITSDEVTAKPTRPAEVGATA